MHEPASKKLSAPDPSNPYLKKSARMANRSFETLPYALSIHLATVSYTHLTLPTKRIV